MKQPITILIADDHEVVRTGLATVIDYEDGMTVIGVAKNGQLAVQLAAERHPSVVIMDLVMPVLGGVEATKRMQEVSPASRIMILTSFGTPDDLRAAQRAGARGILMKSSSNHDIIKAVRRLASGEEVFPPDVRQLLAETEAPVEFSERQLEILHSVARGLSNREIAVQYGISRGLVKKHLVTIFERLGAASRTEATAIALRLRLIEP